tara:strand:- start:532 stop:1191 length:660 start_codon:yes stop_codon:yes gene_type:complete
MFFSPFRLYILITLLSGLNIFSQGGDILIQQYSKGPELNQKYSKWSFSIGPEVNRINSALNTASPKITLGGMINIEYRFSKTVSLLSGLKFVPISYRYMSKDSLKMDRLQYLTIPLILKLNPFKKISFGLGILYNHYEKGQRILRFGDAKVITKYPEGVFSNPFGFSAQVGYHFWDRFNTTINYRWAKKYSPATHPQSNNSKGLQVSLTYTFLRSIEMP